MDTKACRIWLHKQNGSPLIGGTGEEAEPSSDRPFVVGVPAGRENERVQGASGTEYIPGARAVHFRSQEELMEFVLRVLTEDKVAFT